MNEKKKNVLITGGATGIGKRIALELGKEGYQLIINYRNSLNEAKQLLELLNQQGTCNMIVQGDISKKEDCERIIGEVLSVYKHVDAIIHNAGPYIHERNTMAQYEDDEWTYIINGNLNAVYYLSKPILPFMRNNGWGRIITMGFDRVETAPAWIYRSAFAAAKSGLASLTKTMALEEAPYGITVNMVCPGDIVGEWKEGVVAAAVDIVDDHTPVRRPGTGEDIARVISFLLDERSSFITGAIIPVTGGKDVLGKIST